MSSGMTSSKHRKRILFLMVVFLLLTIVMISRLAYWQIYKSSWLEERASSQWVLSVPVSPRRGNIIDAKQRTLAMNKNADTIAAIPKQIVNAQAAAKVLAPILSIDEETLYSKLSVNKSQIYLKRLVDPEVSAKVREQNLQGIIIVKESKRFYPNVSLASHVLGFSGIDKGWSGLELKYDELLQGNKGAMRFGTDDEGQKTNGVEYIRPEDGNTIELTIDIAIQSIMELALEKTYATHNADGVMAIAMDVKTGGILAMAGKPDFDPNSYGEYDEKLWRNPVVSDVFEPGSTFKIITMAAALEEGIVSKNDRFYDPGYIKVSGVTLHCWKSGGHGSQNYEEIIQNSCNPGFVLLGQRLGAERLHKYITDFGFTQKTKVDLPGEGSGIMFELEKMGPVELATTAFGQGPAVTPLQQIRAISAIANKGLMTTPHVVNKVIDKDNNVIYEFKDENKTQVVSTNTAEEVCRLLESVVVKGTGKLAFIEGYRIGGKTGTAQVAKPGGGYYSDNFVASFIGMAPADDPQIALFVAIRNPKGSSHQGGRIAAPLFGEMMRDILRYMDVPTQLTTEKPSFDNYVAVPDLLGLTAEKAAAQLWAKGFITERDGIANGVVVSQTPAPGVKLEIGQKVVIKTTSQSGNSESFDVTVPDVKGLSLKQASMKLGEAGLRIEIDGSGVAVSQDPKPGEVVRKLSIVTVKFKK
ncbi:PASTA domain-containing protein [Clostridium sp. 'deep sea']|uniref:penicillin-binding transpeptidase domain-containing protein n=1 Tax=Clostridium sp. 'deep sea' TaxID=2779445 RepID=UPI00189651C1|nr:penicillin-binding transpeptidase domain-containing protein [Clostridium sp. 'deep sea']QOR36223.1 PASTA domain-containing protein [Clostridium sp. 'deep sea']